MDQGEDDVDVGALKTCRSIDWYAVGQCRTVDANGVRVVIRFVGRQGRRARIAITAPNGSTFNSGRSDETLPLQTGEEVRR